MVRQPTSNLQPSGTVRRPHPVAVRLPPTHRAALQRIAKRQGLSEGRLALRELMAATERLASAMLEADRQALLDALEAEREPTAPNTDSRDKEPSA